MNTGSWCGKEVEPGFAQLVSTIPAEGMGVCRYCCDFSGDAYAVDMDVAMTSVQSQ
jgi:hypothetical protein